MPKRSLSKTAFSMLAAMVCAMPFLAPHDDAHGQWVDSDSGIILEMSGAYIYMQGEKGNHVFEMVGACTWCEEGESITAVFEGLTRVEIYPRPNRLQRPAVRGLIVKDGRQEF